MAVTIEQIAKKAGVSPGTVSRVLNGLNKENRPAIARRSEMIRQIAREMNYRPNHAARQMLRGQFDLVGFLNCGDIGFDWFPRQLVHGLHEALRDQNSRLVVSEVEGKKFSDPSYVPSFLSQAMVDGLIVHPGGPNVVPVMAFFDREPLPVVYINTKLQYQAVFPDDQANAYNATLRLIQAGHRNIGYYYPRDPNELTPHHSVADRLAGFQRALLDHGLHPHRTGQSTTRNNSTDLLPAAIDFLDQYPDMTAALCFDLPEALNLRDAALVKGKRLPHDLCLVVFYEREFHTTTGIPIATSIVPFYEMAEIAVGMIRTINNGDSLVDSIAVPCRSFFDEGMIVPPANPTS